MSNRKRANQVISLVDDDETQRSTRGHKHQRASDGHSNPTLTQRFHDEELEDNSNETVPGSQDYNEGEWRQLELYGELRTKIVGVRYYRGHATPGEMVMIRREPQNAYDSNAIRMLNVRAEQIGHIPRTVAAKLAKYMDNSSLRIEGIINGYMGNFDCPVKLSIFGTAEPVEKTNLVNQMKLDKLPQDAYKQAEKGASARAKLQQEREKELKKLAKDTKGEGTVVAPGQFVGGSTAGFTDLASIIGASERFDPRSMERMTEQFGSKEKDLEMMPMADQPEALRSELLPFQRQGLRWLLSKEAPQLPHRGSSDTVQLWMRSKTDQNVFTNVATNFSLKGAEPPLACGGILADDMGIGKTIQIISLIVADRAMRLKSSQPCGATLIIAPLGVMSNWSSQIEQHVSEEHALRVLTYHGGSKQKLDSTEIKNYDVVITTYGMVSSEYWAMKNPKIPTKQSLFSVEWRRVVVDEGHNLRNPAAKKTVSASSLMSASRWILTGTPIVNTLKDLYSLVKFLGLSGGLDRFELFNAAIIRPLNQGDQRGSQLLQLLMQDICLRRRKDMQFIDLKLPPLTEYVHTVKFSEHEKEKYDALEAEAKGTLDDYRARQATRGTASAKAYRHLLEILIRMRQLCCHFTMCGEGRFKDMMEILENEKVLSLTPENQAALQNMLQFSIDIQEDCPICLDSLKEPVITCCAHIFCDGCISKVLETQQKCPMCRAELTLNSLVRPTKELSAPQVPDIDRQTSSSKVEALISLLRATHKRRSGDKIVVFSQWTSFLDIIQAQLDKHGFVYTRIDGTMSATQRDSAMKALETEPHCTIMLASLAVCSVGLNLVAANQVVLADTWWAPAIEDQAVDRVHRLGQKKPTTVFRLVVEGSIEENVLRIQSDKRKLMNLAFSEKNCKRDLSGKSTRLADLERLLA